MKRRDYLKSIGMSSLGMAVISPEAKAMEMLDGPKPKPKAKASTPAVPKYNYGRTEDEIARDAKLLAEKFFTDHEIKTITLLSDIIIPADAHSGSASQAGVPAFIEFMAKDQPSFQTPLRGGLRWLDSASIKRFGKNFIACTAKEQISLVDEIAYPEKAKPAVSQGVSFFSLMRNLTASGFYSSEMGHNDIGYVGNRPNNWDGVPEEVLKQYGLSYDS
ncbi:gluconate 2-dehydrogenase subunit 3 family protein [Arcicella rigui]|uniref:Gluconate 2-dehydrogenase subunit 3 family protein n=1 Tax=Arcicella rigui TaxID=797020 RepID=A0ABU5Q942_9BACT|nr:gluconate 2-dehydrogenase subunit 3 family protein [Arcicella rigui]MEA5139365.1 gluconate 2-dehydrogenase subunit 3 family protein [Arcicella rigui]